MDNAKRSKYSKGKGEEDFLKDKDWGEQKKDIPGNITMKDSGQTVLQMQAIETNYR